RFVDVRDVAAAGGPVARAGWVLAPDLIALSAVERAALEERAAHGASVVSDVRVGRFDELGRATAPVPAAVDRSAPGVVVDPEFKSRFAVARGVQATATRADGGAPPAVELGVYEDGGSTYVVAVPAWESSADDAGGASASIPRTTLTFTFRQDA